MDGPTFSCFLVKVAARCNLNCDYCYVFNHVDQSWKNLPRVLSEANRKLLAQRIREYVLEKNLTKVLIIYHGGEPLLLGREKLLETTKWIREAVPSSTHVDFSLQTNGVLLNESILEDFQRENIGVSLSLDGPREAQDLHRVTHSKKSSFDDVMRGYNLLIKYPTIFSGVLSVVDPLIKPAQLFEFFDGISPPCMDFLLPDSNYDRPPPMRNEHKDIYINWLRDAFDLWFDKYSHLEVRMFDNILATLSGLQINTDTFGYGDVSLLSIETDGTYHDLDVLKITKEGYSSLGLNLENSSINQASMSERINSHRKLLQKSGLSDTCQKCEVVDICGGGSVPHRFSSKNGFNNPTIYCGEMLSLISHVKERLHESLNFKKVANA